MKKKVLFVANTMQMAGAERILYNIVKNIDKTKFVISVLALVDFGVMATKIKNIPKVNYLAGYTELSGQTELNDKVLKELKKCTEKYKNSSQELYKQILGNEKFDVVISFLEGRVAKFTSFCDDKEAYKIVWIHTKLTNSITKENFLDEKDEYNSYAKFDKIVCVSEEVKETFMKKIGIKGNVVVQHNPIDTNKIQELAQENDKKINLVKKEKNPVVCAVGRLDAVKSYDRLLCVHKNILNDGINHKLWIIGEGQERKKIEEYIAENNLQNTVTLWGYQNNPYKYIKNADIYVCSSLSEGLSSTVIEAAILGKAIVTTECAGMKEILGDTNENGLITENTIEGLQKGLKTVLENKKLRQQYEKNIQKVCKKFKIENTMKQIQEIIDNK